MGDFERAIATGLELIDAYPMSDQSIRRGAWTVVAHSRFETGELAEAELAYARVLELTDEEDESRPALVDNLAASIYEQAQRANAAGDDRSAAGHFLRIGTIAPESAIRASAEYDAAAALIRLEEWSEAASVLESFRLAYPDHELSPEATKQIAFVHRQQGELSRAAAEYERIASEAQDDALRREALLLAGELYEDSQAPDRALDSYLRYVGQFPEPIEVAVVTRFKIAEIYRARGEEAARLEQLEELVAAEAAANPRTPRTRYVAARAALVLAEGIYRRFEQIELVQPFDQKLREKRGQMEAALRAFKRLVDYEVGEITAAATYYMAEVYSNFSQSLLESERPSGLSESELRDYEAVLDEEAFPLEQRAIEVHEKNLELLAAGVYDPWIQKSLDRLAHLMPGRYAKFEASSGLIDSIEAYSYRLPEAAAAAADENEASAMEAPAEVSDAGAW
jgi:outer membrane protein assembly factor BamD (BamD/ComL family)